MYIGLHVKYSSFLTDFHKTIFLTDFRKNYQVYNFMKILLLVAEFFYADRRTDGRIYTDRQTDRRMDEQTEGRHEEPNILFLQFRESS